MSFWTPKQREIHERCKRRMKWTDEEKEEYYQRNKEFYDELNAEFFKKRNESMSANSEQFVPHSMELKDEEEKREKEGEEGKASSIENNGSQQLSLGTNGSGKQYFSSDDECFMHMSKSGQQTYLKEKKEHELRTKQYYLEIQKQRELQSMQGRFLSSEKH